MFISTAPLLVLLVISRSVVAHSASDSSAFHDRNFCTGTNLMILRAGIFPVVKNLYVDGQAVNFQYKDTVVKTSNVVIAAQLKPGLLSMVGTLLPMLPFVKSFACTPVQPSTAAWTQPGFDYTNWPFIKNAPTSAIGATLTQLGATSFALQNINRVLYCRFYLACAGNFTVTPAPTPTVAQTTPAAPTTPATQTTPSTTTSTTTQATTTTTTTTTTTPAPTTTEPTTPAATTTTLASTTTQANNVPPGLPVCVPYGSTTLSGGSQTPLVCQCSSSSLVTAHGWSYGLQAISSSQLQLVDSGSGWYQTIFSPTTPWDTTTAGTYTCYVFNSYGKGSGAVTVDVPNTVYSSMNSPTIPIPTGSLPSFTFNFQVDTCNGFDIWVTDTSDPNICNTCIEISTDPGFNFFQISDGGSPVMSPSWPTACTDQSVTLHWLWINYDASTSTISIGTGLNTLMSTQVSMSLSNQGSLDYISLSAISGAVTYYVYQ